MDLTIMNLIEHVLRLAKLLESHEPGLGSWHQACQREIDAIAEFRSKE